MLRIKARLAGLWVGSLVGLMVVAAGAQAQIQEDFPTQIGTTPLQLPLPQGFSEPSVGAPGFRNLGETMTPATNRLLAVFIADTDIVRVKASQQPTMDRYFMVQTFRQTEGVTASPAEFAQLQEMLRKQYVEISKQVLPTVQGELDRAAAQLSKESGAPGVKLKVGEIKPQEVFHDVPGQISLLALTAYRVEVAGKAQEIPMALGVTTLALKGKMLYFYAYSRYRDATDLAWIKTQTLDWLRRAGS